MSGSPSATAHVEPLLAAYHAGALSPADAAQVERHLRGCAACRERSEQIAIDQIIRAAPAPTVGPELRQRLYARIAAASEASDIAASRATLRDTRRVDDHPLARQHGPRAATGWLSGVAAVLLVALLVGMFLELPHLRQPNHASKKVAPKVMTACPASKTTVDLPANVNLNDLAMTSATDGWAVGAIVGANDGADGATQGAILRYSDCHWSRVALDLENVGLTHISMDSPTDGWAAGQWAGGTANYYSEGFILLHYTGGAWSVVPAAQRPANHGSVEALSMRTPEDGWMLTSGPDEFTNGNGAISVGVSRLWHYQQGAWTQVAPCPIQMPRAIAPSGSDELWVAGSSFTGPGKEQTQYLAHYHNGAWTRIASPGSMQVWSLRAVSPSDIWATGGGNNTYDFDVVAHYDGVAWRMAPGAVPILPTPSLTPGATTTPTTRSMPTPEPGQFNGMLTVTGDGAGWAWTWQPGLITTPGMEAVIGSVYRGDGSAWQSLNWPYSDVGYITSWTTLPDGEIWAIGSWNSPGTQITPLPGGGGTWSVTNYAYLLHYAGGQWSRYVTLTSTS